MLFFLKTYFKALQYSQGNESSSIRLGVDLGRGGKSVARHEVGKVHSYRPESFGKLSPGVRTLS